MKACLEKMEGRMRGILDEMEGEERGRVEAVSLLSLGFLARRRADGFRESRRCSL